MPKIVKTKEKKLTRSESRVAYLKNRGRKFAKDLRTNATKEEKILYKILKDLHIKFVFQQPIICNSKHLYILDFYFPELNKVIELDGFHHTLKAKAKKDRYRTKMLKKEGIFVLRIMNKQLYHLTPDNIKQLLLIPNPEK